MNGRELQFQGDGEPGDAEGSEGKGEPQLPEEEEPGDAAGSEGEDGAAAAAAELEATPDEAPAAGMLGTVDSTLAADSPASSDSGASLGPAIGGGIAPLLMGLHRHVRHYVQGWSGGPDKWHDRAARCGKLHHPPAGMAAGRPPGSAEGAHPGQRSLVWLWKLYQARFVPAPSIVWQPNC